jgi:two-component system LytT family sensor kinase
VWAWSFAAAAVFTVLATTQDYSSRLVEGLSVDLWKMGLREAINWFAWALLAPYIATLGQTLSRLRLGRARTAVAWAVIVLVFVFVHSTLEVATARPLDLVPLRMPFSTHVLARFSGTLAANAVIVGLIALAFNAIEHYNESRSRREREANLRTQLAQAELTVLRMQIQPHFLFNALHAVSAVMAVDVDRARRTLVQLGDLLRSALTHADTQEVRLDEELAFLEKYLEIQRIRFEDRLTVDVLVEPGAVSALVPTLLLQPLVENALRYGVERRTGPGLVRIRAERRGMDLHLEVADDGPGLPETRDASEGFGVGLSNTRARLAQLYGEAQCLDLATAAEGGLAVRIVIPFREQARSANDRVAQSS